jgi:hypothetical protein
VAYSRAALGLLALAAGDLAAAGDHFRDGLIRLRDLDETWGIPLAIEHCAALAGAAGDWARAARLFGAAAARRAALDVPLPPRWAANRDARIAAARAAAPSPVAFEDAWTAGAALPSEAAVDLALP